MAEIILSAREQPDIILDAGGRENHNRLRNLGFEESGHTGFQKELSKTQLEEIDSIKEKENVINKVSVIGQASTDEQYPTAKAVYKALESHGIFEHVKEGKLTEDVIDITISTAEKYKELYLYFKVPSMNVGGAAVTPKARIRAYTLNDGATSVNKQIYDLANSSIDNYTTAWGMVFHIKMLGNFCATWFWHQKDTNFDYTYALTNNTSTNSGSVAPRAVTARKYIDNFRVVLQSSDNSRYFPAGTTYTVWGIRA